MSPLDVITLVAPLLAYGVFYAIREKVSVRGTAQRQAHALRACLSVELSALPPFYPDALCGL